MRSKGSRGPGPQKEHILRTLSLAVYLNPGAFEPCISEQIDFSRRLD
jgi:hypothetical protein